MTDLTKRDCPDCGVVDHAINAVGDVICCGCGRRDGSEELGDCQEATCPEDATHLVVWNPVHEDRQKERYCERHAELAAKAAKEDTAGDLFYGPVEIEE